jgi:Putative DNA-binding domain
MTVDHGFVEALDSDSDDIDEQFLLSLIQSKHKEWEKLDYKTKLPFGWERTEKGIEIKKWMHETRLERIDFLKDISSFANASGGVLMYGISDHVKGVPTGIPQKIRGLDIRNEDEEKIRNHIDRTIRDGIKPTLGGVSSYFIPVLELKKVVLLDVPKSWQWPHRVELDHNRFWARTKAAGLWEMDVADLRAAFTLSENGLQRIDKFKADRIRKITESDIPETLAGDLRAILHVVPLSSCNPDQQRNVATLENDPRLHPFAYSGGFRTRPNNDGLLAYIRSDRTMSRAYTQIFTTGVIESVDSQPFVRYFGAAYKPDVPDDPTPDSPLFLSINEFECGLIRTVQNFINVLKELSIAPPVYLFLTLIGFKGVVLSYVDPLWADTDRYCDRNFVPIRKACIQNYEQQLSKTLQDCLDSIWKSFGHDRSLNFDEKGDYLNRLCSGINNA